MNKLIFSDTDIRHIKTLISENISHKTISNFYNCNPVSISRLKNTDRYKSISLMPENGTPFKYNDQTFIVYATGNVWSIKLERFLFQETDKDGYSIVTLAGKKFKLHRLILTVFDREPEDWEVCRHKDGNTTHNNLSNLQWGSVTENNRDKERHGTKLIGEQLAASKLKENDVRIIRNTVFKRGTVADFARRFNVSGPTIIAIRDNKTWQHIKRDE